MIIVYIVILLLVVFFVIVQPLLVLVISWRSTNFSETYLSQSLPYSTDMSGFAGLPDFNKGDQLIGAATNQESCENGFYMGALEMTNVDCTTVCNATSSEQFMYKYITRNNVVVNNQYLRKGGWCLPTILARCNLNISVAVKSVGHYECISRFPQLLGGPYGNDIIGCAPKYEFKDNLKQLIYANHVPSTTVIDNLDEKLPNSSEYRYTCNTDKSLKSFESRPDLGNRFHMFYDSCNFFDPDGKLVNDRCDCSNVNNPTNIVKALDNNQQKDVENLCTTCTSGYAILDERDPQDGAKYGMSFGINCVDPERIEYYKTMYVEMHGVLPCGMKTLLRMRENPNTVPNYGCHRALINATNSYTPEMLQQING